MSSQRGGMIIRLHKSVKLAWNSQVVVLAQGVALNLGIKNLSPRQPSPLPHRGRES
jgi:hypothetical protein